jgi:hypothetical protein
MRRRFNLATLVCSPLLVACAGTGATDTDGMDETGGVDDQSCAIRYAWEPGAGDLTSFPTAEMLVDDASTRTGKRVSIDPAVFSDLEDFEHHVSIVDQLGHLDGFGLNGDMYFAFDGALDVEALPEPSAEADPTDAAGIVVLPADAPAYLASVELQATQNGENLVMFPITALPESTMIATWIRRDLPAAGDCLGSSDGMRAMLDASADDPALTALIELGVVGSGDELAVLHSFPTQTVSQEPLAVAEYIAALPDDGRFDLTDHSCAPSGSDTHCISTLAAADFRDAETGIVPFVPGEAIAEQTDWDLVVHAWLPGDGSGGPFPTVVHGHGLTQEGEDAEDAAVWLNPLGIAVVALSAVEHGDHPSVTTSTTGLAATLNFFAIDVNTGSVDVLRLRDHVRQSNYDKLYLTRALALGADVDGDGASDVDPDRLGYSSVSMGSIMGGQFLALTDAYGAGAMHVGGGRISTVMSEPDTAFGTVKDILFPSGFNRVAERRLFAMVQTLLDGCDPSPFATMLISNRVDGGDPVDMLLTASLDDDTVPNVANWSHARALSAPIVGAELRPVLGVEATGTDSLAGNLDGTTAGLLQFDVVDAAGTPATHNNMPFSELSAAAWTHFFETEFASGTGEIIDPYVELGIPHG